MAATLVEKDTDVNKLKNIYDEMKKYHPFLTSSDDYTAAVMIAKQPDRASHLVERAEKYYNALNEKGLSKGNDLQLLAHMLVMNGDYSQELTRNVMQAKEAFEKNYYKVKKIHYPSLGIIALSNQTNEAVKLVQDLTAMKMFKWYKDMALTIASLFLSQDYADAPAGLTAAVEAMIQAQQAAMIAATTASDFCLCCFFIWRIENKKNARHHPNWMFSWHLNFELTNTSSILRWWCDTS